ncbi:hypothetical protein J1N35_044846 [Gossypium stocksii]|uniref:Uncharacterized protein n=1 Tax=Gossypium stocksii TaxID=47602 RepID=A0A9D3U9Z6_9ROSI|nr:hypothetical protein J1N35_044846 [Gossypium stocksii]
MSWIIEHIFDLSLESEMHFLMTNIEPPSIWILRSFSFNLNFTASKHACTSAVKAEMMFSWMVALEAITLPLPSRATTPDRTLKKSLLKPVSKLIFISSLEEETHVSLITALGDIYHSPQGVWTVIKSQGREGTYVALAPRTLLMAHPSKQDHLHEELLPMGFKRILSHQPHQSFKSSMLFRNIQIH